MKNVDGLQVARILIASLAAAVFWGCATPVDSPPEWISGGGALSEVQLVAYGRGDSDAQAFRRAQDDATAQISQILVRDLEAEGIAITSSVGAAVENRADFRVETAVPADTYQRRDSQGAIEQYLLYDYQRDERNRDIADIRQTAGLGALTVRDEEPAEPAEPAADETVADSLLEEVRALLAESVPDSAAERRGRLEEISRLTAEVSVTVEPLQRTVPLGDTLFSSFTVEVRTADEAELLSDLPFRIEIRGPLVDGRRITSEMVVRTGQDGTARIPVSTPSLAGTTRIVAEPGWLAELVSTWEANLDDAQLQDILSSIAEQLRARAVVEVTSQASSIPTAMIVLDRDIAGNPIGSGDTMRGMVQEFSATDFRIREVDLSEPARRRLSEAESISVADLYDILPFDVLSRTERVIVGDARIVEFDEEDGFTVVVEVEAGAFDLRRDQVLARVSFRERISGSDARSAIRTAFQAAGRRLVRQIVPRLP